MEQSGDADAPRLKVFVSYSRQDLAFTDEIVAGLELEDTFEVLVDRNAVHEGEDWKTRLGSLIASADTVVFVVSPASARSAICAWEVELAAELSKRILPIQSAPLNGESPPPQLAALNYIRFDPNEDGRARSFVAGLAALRRTLNTDISWLREHTRLLNRAQEWDSAGRVENRLLIGSDIAEAKRWLERRPKGAPAPNELHHSFISASEQADTNRISLERERADKLEAALGEVEQARKEEMAASKRAQRRTVIGILASVSLGILGIGGGWGYKLYLDHKAFLKRALLTNVAGQMSAYATQIGNTAMDGDGDNSPYTTEILKQLSGKNKSVLNAVLDANAEVVRMTAGRQLPFFSTNLSSDIFLHQQPDSRRRKALVVGVGKYDYLPQLKNPANDARAWSSLFKKFGFEVTHLADPSLSDIKIALRKFTFQESPDTNGSHEKPNLAHENTLTVFFFAGYSVHIDGRTYLIPRDSRVSDQNDLDFEAISLREIESHLRKVSASSLIFLDSDLDNPFATRAPNTKQR